MDISEKSAAPTPEEVRRAIDTLRGKHGGGMALAQWGNGIADMIERLAAVNTNLNSENALLLKWKLEGVPEGCVVVGYLDGRGRFFYADDPHMEVDHTGMREVFAAGEVK